MPALLPHQPMAINWLKSHPTGYLAGAPGTGKTAEIVCAACESGADKILITAPVPALYHWKREFARFGNRQATVVRNADDIKTVKSPIWITNPDRLYDQRFFNALRAESYDLLVADEAHAYKSPAAKRSRLMLGKGGLVHRAKRRWFASGTPMPQGPQDLYLPLRVLWPDVIEGMNRDSFIMQYHVLAADRVKILGAKNMHLLRAKLQPHFLFQGTELLSLPPLRFGVIPLDPAELHFDRNLLDRALVLAKLEAWNALDDQDLMGLVTETHFHLSTARAMLAEAKAVPVATSAADKLFSGAVDKLVIFCDHLAPLKRLNTMLAGFNPVVVTGDVGAQRRDDAVTRFQSDPACRVFLSQTRAGGVAITLTAAAEVWFLDCPWSAADLIQAAKRLHRIGQMRSVLARVWTVGGTIDDAVSRVVARKAGMATALDKALVEGELIWS
jgi:SWI/SNF-related matrix-associated actin-dependent regulator 1 of chromatin subfamily A